MKKFVYTLVIIVSVLSFSCTDNSHSNAGGVSSIQIYATNDMHAQIEPYAKVIPYMQKARQNEENVLLLSAGDMFTGNPYVDFASEPGMPMIELMNEAGYDWAALGNHEFDYGQVALQTCIDNAGFGLLCANIKVTPKAELTKQFEPYTFVKLGGIKVCILSLIETENIYEGKPIPSCHPKHLEGLEFRDPLEVADEYRHLRKQCDLFIALTHLGVKGDSLLAVRMPELDVIVGGHTDTKLDNGMLVNGVLVTQAGGKMKYVGKATIEMKENKVASKAYELIEVASMEEDPEVKARIQKYYDDPAFTRVVGISEDEFPTRRSVTYMMADVSRELFNVDFSFENIGGVRCESFPKGEITMVDILNVSPFNNDMMVVEMTAADIRSLLLNTPDHLKDEVDLVPSGLKYILTYSGNKINDVELMDYDGCSLDENKVYSVAVNSYIASTYKYNCQKPAASLDCTQIEMLESYLSQHVLHRSPDEDRFTVIR